MKNSDWYHAEKRHLCYVLLSVVVLRRAVGSYWHNGSRADWSWRREQGNRSADKNAAEYIGTNSERRPSQAFLRPLTTTDTRQSQLSPTVRSTAQEFGALVSVLFLSAVRTKTRQTDGMSRQSTGMTPDSPTVTLHRRDVWHVRTSQHLSAVGFWPLHCSVCF